RHPLRRRAGGPAPGRALRSHRPAPGGRRRRDRRDPRHRPAHRGIGPPLLRPVRQPPRGGAARRRRGGRHRSGWRARWAEAPRGKDVRPHGNPGRDVARRGQGPHRAPRWPRRAVRLPEDRLRRPRPGARVEGRRRAAPACDRARRAGVPPARRGGRDRTMTPRPPVRDGGALCLAIALLLAQARVAPWPSTLGEVAFAASPADAPALLETLRSASPAERRAAAAGLGEVGDARAVDGLARAPHDPDTGVRQAASDALWAVWSRSGDPAVDALFQQGVELMSAQRLAEAVDVFGEVIRRAPGFAEGWNKRATVYY